MKFLSSIARIIKKHRVRFIVYFGLYLLGGSYLYINQNSFIYFPQPARQHSYPLLKVKNGEHSIHTIVLNSDKPTNNAIIYFGGNAELALYSASDFEYRFKNSTVYLMNYRGFGSSPGQASEKANCSDALKLFDFVHEKFLNITVIGRSLGSGVATYVAAKRKAAKLVLITPYDSMQNLVQAKIIVYPIFMILHEKYLSILNVKNIKCPCLVLVAESDQVIPYINSKNLIDAFPKDQITSLILKNTDHNTIPNHPKYLKSIFDFIQRP